MSSRSLSASDRESLERGSGIPADLIEARGYWTATSKNELRLLGFAESQLITPALVIPMHTVDGNVGSYQIRPHQPRLMNGKPVKYESPKGGTNLIDVPPLVRPLLAQSQTPLWVTEGVKKADSAAAHGLACVALAGVWSWRGKVDGGGSLEISDWDRIALKGRRVYLAFDSDLMDKEPVQVALRKLGEMLGRRGAEVRYVYIPTGDGRKVGLDDYLVAGGSTEELVRNATVMPPYSSIRIPGQVVRTEDGEKQYKLTDLGNAQRLVDQFGEDIRYNPQWATWLVWQGTHWEADESKSFVQRLAHAVVKGMWGEIADMQSDDPKRKPLLQWAQRSESARGIRDMLEVARTLKGIAITVDQLDSKPHLLNVQNGTIDLSTMKMREHRREDLLTAVIDISYNPEAKVDLWAKFLNRILPDPEVLEMVGRMSGYALSGENSEKKFFFLYGARGNNGKSVFIEVLEGIFGPYAKSTPTETFIKNPLNAGKIPTEVARLRGTRLCIASEAGENQQLNEELVRAITGRDTITARRLYQESFEFRANCVIMMTGNYKPTIKGNDDAMWGRVIIVPFEVVIPPEEQVKKLAQKILAEEAEGVLAWLVYYCKVWRTSGLGVSSAVQGAIQQYRVESDILGHFLEECVQDSPMNSTRASELYTRYARWAKEQGMKPMTSTAFGRRLGDRGLEKTKDKTGWYYLKISIIE